MVCELGMRGIEVGDPVVAKPGHDILELTIVASNKGKLLL
jgi:hypothetical protein